MKNNFFKKGMSLVEVIVYIAIFTMIVGSFVTFISSMTSTRLHNQMVLEINDQGQKAMKVITQTIRNAKYVNSPTIGNTASNLSLAMYLTQVDPTVFSSSGGVLYITEGAGSAIDLTNNKVVVSDLTFSNFSRTSTPDIIKISFKLDSVANALGGNYSFTFNGSAELRK